MDKTLRLDKGQIEVVDDEMAEVLKHKTSSERIRIAFNLWMAAYDMLISYLSKTNPDWDSDRLKEEVVRRLAHGAF